MKKVEMVGNQGDVVIFSIDEFPVGIRIQDDLTKKGQLALGELSGHHHHFVEPEVVDLFKMKEPEFKGLSFFQVNKPTKLTHGLIKGFKGREADQDYHSEVLLKEGKYITGIVEETDWLTRTVRKVID